MKEIPFLFSTPMVQALLDDRKTVTRRMAGLKELNENPDDWEYVPTGKVIPGDGSEFVFLNKKASKMTYAKPRAVAGDHIYAREATSIALDECGNSNGDSFGKYLYAASGDKPNGKWTPSIHMPKAAARFWMKCTGVRVERLQDITEEDAVKEGILPVFEKNPCFGGVTYPGQYYENYGKTGYTFLKPIESFATLIDSVNDTGTWDKNPWVFVYDFKVLSKTGKP